MSITPFKDQDYNELVGDYDADNLFEDPEFAADYSSLYYTKSPSSSIVWRRPTVSSTSYFFYWRVILKSLFQEVFEEPTFISNDIDRNDMNQGSVGNCWFIAAVVGIMQSPALLNKVIPKEQSFSENYTGMFHFRFWIQGGKGYL